MKRIKKKICGITGSSGTLGSKIIKSKAFRFIKFKGDITNKRLLDNWVSKYKFDLFIHLAAIVPVKKVMNNFNLASQVNYVGTKNLVNSLIKHQVNLKWFFFSSTSHVYNFNKGKISENISLKPISKYGKTKLYAENYIIEKFNKKKMNFCIGRIFSFFSSNQNLDYLVPILIKKLSNKKNKNIILKDMNHYRDFIKIGKIINIIKFLYKKKYNGIINIGSGKKIFLKNIVKKLNKYKLNVEFIDKRKNNVLVADISKLRRLGYKDKNLSPF